MGQDERHLAAHSGAYRQQAAHPFESVGELSRLTGILAAHLPRRNPER